MRTFTTLLSLTLLLGLLTACRGPGSAGDGAAGATTLGADDAMSLRLEVPNDPTVGPATVRVYLLDDGDGVEGAEVEVAGTMTHAGMAPVIRDAQAAKPGLYVVEDFEFTMAGDWIISAEVTLPDGETLREEATVSARQP